MISAWCHLSSPHSKPVHRFPSLMWKCHRCIFDNEALLIESRLWDAFKCTHKYNKIQYKSIPLLWSLLNSTDNWAMISWRDSPSQSLQMIWIYTHILKVILENGRGWIYLSKITGKKTSPRKYFPPQTPPPPTPLPPHPPPPPPPPPPQGESLKDSFVFEWKSSVHSRIYLSSGERGEGGGSGERRGGGRGEGTLKDEVEHLEEIRYYERNIERKRKRDR